MQKLAPLFLALFIISGNVFAADKNIECSGTTCSTNFSPNSQIDKPFWTAVDVGNNADNINVSVPTGQTPRSIRLSVKNGAFPGYNLLLDLSSRKGTENAGNTLVIGDYFNNLSIKLNGFNGTAGKDSSQLCATRMKAGNYGNDAKTFFNQRRQADPGLNPDRCDRVDLSYLQTYGFTCDDGSFTAATGQNPIVEVQRIKKKAQCSGVLVQDLCVWRTRDIWCQWRQQQDYCWSGSKGKGGGCRTDWNNNAWNSYIRMREDTFNNELNRLGWVGFCNTYTSSPYGKYGANRVFPYTYWHSLSGLQIDPNTYQPVPGSDWVTYFSRAYGSCFSGSVYIKTFYRSVVAYDETGTDCRKEDISFADDPFKVIPWTYTGMAQESSFGTEAVQCAVGECPVQSSLSDVNRSIETINPESGTNGTQQGSGIALVYDVNVTPVAQAIIGQSGAGGRADLDSPSEIRFCYKKRDADTDGINSEFARNPTVAFRRYTWRAITSGAGGNPGVPPAASDKSVNVYKKIDSSVRHLLTKEVL